MADEYVQVHTTLLTHRKGWRLARELDISQLLARAHLVTLWLNCLQHAADGCLEDWDAEDVARYSEWEGDPKQLVDALIKVGFLDYEHDALLVHDWADYSGAIRKAEERAKDRERKAKKRAEERVARRTSEDSPEVSAEVHGQSEGVRGCPVLTEQNRTELNRTSSSLLDRAREDDAAHRDVALEELDRIVQTEFKQPGIPGRWLPDLQAMAPFSRWELDYAWRDVQRSTKRPNVGLLVRKLQDIREAPERPSGVNGQRGPPLAFRANPKDADVMRSIAFARQLRAEKREKPA